jgi:GxxExxY protein
VFLRFSVVKRLFKTRRNGITVFHERHGDEQMKDLPENSITDAVIGAAIEVHKALGPGLLESVYESCLAHELSLRQIGVEQQVAMPVRYKGHEINTGYRIDLLIEKQVIVELKAVDTLLPVHEAQILTYMKLMNCRLGLLINFNVPRLKQGLKRMLLD